MFARESVISLESLGTCKGILFEMAITANDIRSGFEVISNWNKFETPLVSICCITYNHENFITEAIEGVLMQLTNFPFEIIIANDASTDRTDALINNLVKNHPKGDLIKYFNHESNVGMQANFLFALDNCKGKYIAMCEGDDYWTDPYKLQKQVDFLETNEDYVICFHRVHELIDGKQQELSKLNTSLKQETYIIEDLAKENFIHTASVIFRNRLVKKFPVWFLDSPIGDYVLHMLNAAHGKIKYLPEAMAVYRRHANGIWNMKTELRRYILWVWMLEHLALEFKGLEVEKILLRQKAESELYIANCYKDSDEKEYFNWLHKAFLSSFDFFIDWIKNKEQAHTIKALEPRGFVYRLKTLIKRNKYVVTKWHVFKKKIYN